ncbi:MAG: GerMN domain-containing protein, partial [Clostridia bacterium]|nr:GerMN domain-containing protein [Clostridia bacterium]
MKKRAMALLLAIVMLCSFAACGKKEENVAQTEQDALLESQNSTVAVPSETLVLYFPGVNDTETLYSERRSVGVSSASSLVDAAINALLAGPRDETLYAIIPSDVRLEMTEQSANLVTVHLSEELLSLDERQLLLAKISIVNTLTSIPGVEYVTLMCNEKEVTIMGYTSGPEGMFSGTLDEKIQQIEQAVLMGSQSRTITLYFQDGSNDYLLPEVRTVTDTQDMATTIINELLAGPADTMRCTPVFSEGVTLLESPTLMQNELGQSVLTVNISTDPAFWTESSGRKMIRIGSIVLSILNNMPDVDYVSVQMDSVSVNRYVAGKTGNLSSAMFRDLVGDTITLYFPDENAQGLVQVQRSVDQSSVGRPRQILYELLEGPDILENENAMPLAAGWQNVD